MPEIRELFKDAAPRPWMACRGPGTTCYISAIDGSYDQATVAYLSNNRLISNEVNAELISRVVNGLGEIIEALETAARMLSIHGRECVTAAGCPEPQDIGCDGIALYKVERAQEALDKDQPRRR